jgi:very-short-patch-repair endonuclease
MDFLLLLPRGVRVVLEVDGKHHFSGDDGSADSKKYAAMVSADRELKLAGYHVFHFGAAELVGESGHITLRKFFTTLFMRFGVRIPAPREPE